MKNKVLSLSIAAIVGAFTWESAEKLQLLHPSGTYLVENGERSQEGLVLLAKKKRSPSFERPQLFVLSGGEAAERGFPPAEFTLSPFGKIEVVRWSETWGTQAPWLSQK